jgi:hypothetical protein
MYLLRLRILALIPQHTGEVVYTRQRVWMLLTLHPLPYFYYFLIHLLRLRVLALIPQYTGEVVHARQRGRMFLTQHSYSRRNHRTIQIKTRIEPALISIKLRELIRIIVTRNILAESMPIS